MFAFFIFVFTVSSLTHAENMASSPSDQGHYYCLLPAYPEHGSYTIRNHSSATPGQRYPYVMLDIFCNAGYIYNSAIKTVFCINGQWSASIHTCVRDMQGFCTLPTEDLSVIYRYLSSPGTCESLVPTGTLVIPVCSPAYFSVTKLSVMQCRNGTWDYNPICKPACGLTTQHRQLEGTSNNHLELPWYVVIYKKKAERYELSCGGSLITATKIISAASCFFIHELSPASDFKVAVNKMYPVYNDTRDRTTQYSDVDKIIIPASYRGYETNYENNIAIVVVKTPFIFHWSVLPVCLDFDNDLDSTQLERNSGKTVRWSNDRNYSDLSRVLNVVDFSYMKNEDCIPVVPSNNLPYLTSEKLCAKVYCEIDTESGSKTWTGPTSHGSGLAFLGSTTQRYYLRGVISDPLTFIENPDGVIYAVTPIVKLANFLIQHL